MYDKRVVDTPPHISIIIPVRNDAEALIRTLDHLDQLPGIESARCSWLLQATDRARHVRWLAVGNFSGLTIPPGLS